MRLKVEHTTVFQYSAPVYETATEIRLRPIDEMASSQRVLDFDLKIQPYAPLFTYTDYFGNCVYNFNLLQQHNELTIVSRALVETGFGRALPTHADERRSLDFLNETRFVHLDDAVREFSGTTSIGGDAGLLTVAESICQEINRNFTYEPGVTDVHSPSSEVIALRRGVCQDFAHVMIAACRVRGIPARYVSGYLYGGVESEGDNRESHAWCEVYAGPTEGWIALDPTHSTMYVDERYVKIGIGRDYSDVTPIRGTYKGAASETLKVVVRMTEA